MPDCANCILCGCDRFDNRSHTMSIIIYTTISLSVVETYHMCICIMCLRPIAKRSTNSFSSKPYEFILACKNNRKLGAMRIILL